MCPTLAVLCLTIHIISPLDTFPEYSSIHWSHFQGEFTVIEFLPFFVIGILGGLLGALYNKLNHMLTKWRREYVMKSKVKRMAEVFSFYNTLMLQALLVTTLIASLEFWVPAMYPQCSDIPKNYLNETNGLFKSNPQVQLTDNGTIGYTDYTEFFIRYSHLSVDE